MLEMQISSLPLVMILNRSCLKLPPPPLNVVIGKHVVSM